MLVVTLALPSLAPSPLAFPVSVREVLVLTDGMMATSEIFAVECAAMGPIGAVTVPPTDADGVQVLVNFCTTFGETEHLENPTSPGRGIVTTTFVAPVVLLFLTVNA
jgi:hypothetical protein